MIVSRTESDSSYNKKLLFCLVLGVIDRVGRPDPRSRPKSGRDPDFSGIATRIFLGSRPEAWVVTRNFLWVATRFGRDPAGCDRGSGRDPVTNQKSFLSEISNFYSKRDKTKYFWRKFYGLSKN
jgi:hypothetical protein